MDVFLTDYHDDHGTSQTTTKRLNRTYNNNTTYKQKRTRSLCSEWPICDCALPTLFFSVIWRCAYHTCVRAGAVGSDTIRYHGQGAALGPAIWPALSTKLVAEQGPSQVDTRQQNHKKAPVCFSAVLRRVRNLTALRHTVEYSRVFLLYQEHILLYVLLVVPIM